MVGPFRTSRNDLKENPRTITFWEVRDDIARWSDGTSNQIIFGEKAIASEGIGVCQNGGPSGSTGRHDCSYPLSDLDLRRFDCLKVFGQSRA